MSPEHIEIPGEVGEAEPHGGRLVSVATVLSTLVLAITAFMQASALSAHDEAAVRAERLAAMTANVAASNRDQAQIQIDRWLAAGEERRQSRRAAAGGNPLDATLLSAVAAATARDTRAIAGGQPLAVDCSVETATCKTQPLGPIRAGGYSQQEAQARYLEASQAESYRLSALREAANQQADGAENRFAHLAAALTGLAVAVFLFGYSLTPQGRPRRALFSTVATGAVLWGLGWAIYFGVRGIDRPPASAAVAFASGQVALQDGNYEDFVAGQRGRADADYAVAIEQFRQATREAPHAVSAYAGLAQAEFAKGQPPDVGIFIPPSPAPLRAAVADDRRAIANGSEAPTVRADLASNLLSLGLSNRDVAAVREARSASAEAALRFAAQAAEGRHPGALLISARYTVAEADLALGAPGTRREYCAAIKQMLALGQEVPPWVIADASWTDLKVIIKAYPRLAGEARALQHEVRAATRGGSPCQSPARPGA